jgi:multiple RNA-binding domain-containing protein 1
MRSVDATKAFKSLAYARFGSVPLYLEWAPGNIFDSATIKQNEEQLRHEEAQIAVKSKVELNKLNDDINEKNNTKKTGAFECFCNLF